MQFLTCLPSTESETVAIRLVDMMCLRGDNSVHNASSGEMGHLKLMNNIKLYPQLRKSAMEVEG